jgi:hypothetical protein
MKQAASHRSSTARRDAGGDGTAAIVASPNTRADDRRAELVVGRSRCDPRAGTLAKREHDLVLVPYAAAMKNAIAGARLEIVEGEGHEPPLANPGKATPIHGAKNWLPLISNRILH